MSAEELERAVNALRSAELRPSRRGVDPEQARRLLDEAADALAEALRTQRELRRELEKLQGGHDERAIGRALIAATQAGAEIVARAREEAASMAAEAEAQASALLERVAATAQEREQEATAARKQFEQEIAAARKALEEEHASARTEAEEALSAARSELARLEQEEVRLRSLMADSEHRLVEIAKAALEELEGLAAGAESATDADLVGDLRPQLDARDIVGD